MADYRKHEALHNALLLIKQNGGQMRSGEIFANMANSFPQNNYENESTKSGNLRWENWLLFYSIDAVKAGFIIKNNGIWHLTEEGDKALSLSIEQFADTLSERYNEWESNKISTVSVPEQEDITESALNIDTIYAQASDGIRQFIAAKNPYEFQELVAALLRAMGYYTPFIAPKGKDGGVDIIAYRDPLGTILPRVKVQVKHYPNSTISVDVVRNLIGVLAKQDEVGIVVASGTFTNEAKREARHSHTSIRLIDIDEFISLWLSYYNTMSEDDKCLLPVIPIYFIKSTPK